jgi:hypothetical protein
MSPTLTYERRGFPRGYVAAIATVFSNDRRIGDYAVRDLSARGALLAEGPALPPDEPCKIHLRMSGLGSLTLAAVTVHGVSGQGIGVRFTDLRPEVADGLEELVQQELERSDEPSVLIASPDLGELAWIADQLAAIGERPLLASGALDLYRWLSDPDTIVACVLVGPMVAHHGGEIDALLHGRFARLVCHRIDPDTTEEDLQILLDEGRLRAKSRHPGRPHAIGH